MKIASHDTMSYLPIKQWYLKPVAFAARCQSVSLEEQFDQYGVRAFDFRIWFDKNNNPVFSHGAAIFIEDVYDTLEYLDSKNQLIYVRIMLEEDKLRNKKSNILDIENLFIDFCNSIERDYKNIKFYGGYRKFDYKILYRFQGNDDPIKVALHSSTTSFFPNVTNKLMNNKQKNKIINRLIYYLGYFIYIMDDLFPYLYAKTHNKKSIKKYRNDENLDKFLAIDFVHIGMND